MTIHKEGTVTISITAVLMSLLNLANFSFLFPISVVGAWIFLFITIAFFLFIVSFLECHIVTGKQKREIKIGRAHV